ncbi:molybdopterin-dependent oxidoreductase [Acuticoccus sp. M5D2P5]|uniref:xanthine dehydrogenase family protein molybdopterin-binding subunit n=1 Tax=Acuticoccus kalidii TaxID=2910977 RepID=UPI001F42FDAD|nr:molybdopterin cofactor-binding domain-containing protein [Acuticoccus kalidii]MCF3933756.1 molybdopterin-dependent oxidoreductase [Acuticoccus kalidii]
MTDRRTEMPIVRPDDDLPRRTGLSRRSFIRLGVFSGIAVTLSRVVPAQAIEVDSTKPAGDWMGPDGRPRYRWDAISKVTGDKVFARDFRARDLAGWPQTQAHAFFVKATRADRVFEDIDLSALGPDLQPDRVVLHEDLANDRITVPQKVMGHGFYGYDFLTPKGQTPRMLGHPVALLVYSDFDRFVAAKRTLAFRTDTVRYGEDTGPKPPANYGVDRWVRVGSDDPFAEPLFSGLKDGPIRGGFDGNTPVWPPTLTEPLEPPTQRLRDRSVPLERPPRSADEQQRHEEAGMGYAADIAAEIDAAKSAAGKLVLERSGFSQSIDPSAMEPDNGNAWYDAETRTLHILAATQSPYGVAQAAAEMVKDCAFPVDTIDLLTGTTVGYGSKDYSIFPLYTVMAAFYGDGLPVRLANNRYEQFQMGMKRHSFDIDITLVADRESGHFEILKGSYACNGGGRANLSVAVSHEAIRGAQSMYYFPKSDLTAVALASPAVEAGSMRGFGALQAQTILELMVDEAAEALDIDAIELRRRNALAEGYANTQGGPQGGAMRNVDMLDRAAAHPLWRDRAARKAAYEAANPGQRYGVGYAQVNKVYGAGGDVSALALEFEPDGRLVLRHCCQEIGTGATTAQQVMIWQAIGKAPDAVTFGITDFPELPLTTDGSAADGVKNPFWTPSYLPDMSSSASVYYLGFATRQVGRFLFEHTLWPAARSIWSRGVGGGGISPLWVTLADLRITEDGVAGGGMRPIPFDELAAEAHRLGLITGVAMHTYSLWQWATAEFDVPTVGPVTIPADALSVRYGNGASDALKARMTTGGYDFIKRSSVTYPPNGRGNGDPMTNAASGCLVAVSVTEGTGAVEVVGLHSLLDAGRPIVPELVSGQQQGGLAMGLGHALMEELPLYEDGPGDGTWNFNRYKLPRAADVAVWAQTSEYLPPLADTDPPKGIAEAVMVPVIAATGNAIAHATGQRFYELPFTSDKIAKALP